MSNWTEVVALQEIPNMGSRIVDTGKTEIAVFRTSDDQVFAIRNACPHKGGPLSDGIVHGNTVTCPLHNWKIDLASGEALGPDEGCSNVFPAKVENGQVFVDFLMA
ncbi:MAG: nitrite reductase small subunit NirD [Gammaproteobacteria bacterium]|nr:nitrite reductase small subunit NirD [Gammaproteobacteria bacterium]MCW8924203.1 nitrite reductase small subunit NirD [Gammaproteobacteria bacterium]